MNRREMLMSGVAFAIRAGKVKEAVALLEAQAASGFIRAATLDVRSENVVLRKAFGKAPGPDSVFLLASISKPMTVTAVMTCVDRKEIVLDAPVQRYVPEFRGEGRELVLVRHLLTHTSGLPDMLPENDELRKHHAPLSDFVKGTCRTPLLFRPGTEVRYQSMGILLAAEIVQRVTKQSLPEYLTRHVFQPLEMQQTSLGLGGRSLSQVMLNQVAPATDWDWNSPYWRNLASPWGGVHSTGADVTKFLRCFVARENKILRPESAAAMTSLQTAGLNGRYGYGWSLDAEKLGAGCSTGTFGHSGSTGTLCWMDGKRGISFVLLTSKPAEQSNRTVLRPVSDLVSYRS